MTPAVALVFLAVVGGTTRPAEASRLSAVEAIAIASGAPGLACLLPPSQGGQDLRPEARFDPVSGQWVVELRHQGRAVYRILVDDDQGAVVREGVLDAVGGLKPPADVARRVRDDPALRPVLREFPAARLLPRYDVGTRTWSVSIAAEDRTLAVAFVGPEAVRLEAAEPPAAGGLARLIQLAERIRPDLGQHQWLYLAAAAFILLFVDWRRVLSLRTLDLLMIAALVPIRFLLRSFPETAYTAIMVVTGYFFLRCLVRGVGQVARKKGMVQDQRENGVGDLDGSGPRPHFPGRYEPCRKARGALIAAVVLVLGYHAALSSGALVEQGEAAGLVGGERYLATGVMPYGALGRGFDTYGPAHFLLHGLPAQVWPSGVDWREYDPVRAWTVEDYTAARVLAFACHALTAATLVWLGRRHGGTGRVGWLLALAYLLTVHTGYLYQTTRRLPGLLVLLAFAAWPCPVSSAAFLALGTATLWFPVFLVPLYFGAFLSRKKGARAFLLTYVLVGAVFLGLSLVGPERPDRRLAKVVRATVLAQEGSRRVWQPGTSLEGFWGQPALSAPAFGAVRWAVFAGYATLCLALAVWPKGKTPARLAALAAAVLIGTQLWKSNRTGEYVGWYLPMMLVALFLPFRPAGETEGGVDPSSPGRVESPNRS